MPENIRRTRNIALVLSIFEVFLSLAMILFYVRRRSRSMLLLFVFTILATIGGLYAKICLNQYGLMIHAIYSVSILGGFYIYVIIGHFLTESISKSEEEDEKNNHAMSPASKLVMLFITSFPLLGLFIMGIYSLILLLNILEEFK